MFSVSRQLSGRCNECLSRRTASVQVVAMFPFNSLRPRNVDIIATRDPHSCVSAAICPITL